MDGIRVIGTGSYLPLKIVTNFDMELLVDTSDEWISTRTGVQTRHAVQGEPTSALALSAAREAMEQADCAPEELDMIVCSTVSSEMYTPSMSCIVQGALGAKNAFCFDINCACSGFVYALDMVYHYMLTHEIRTALIVGAETLTRMTNYQDRASCVLFGDGAGACVVQTGVGRYAAQLGADGTGGSLLYAGRPFVSTPFETAKDRTSKRTMAYEEDGLLHMDGKEVYKFSTSVMPTAIEKACSKLGVTPEAIQLIIPHQANIRIVQTAMKHLKLPLERAYINIDHVGNTSSASVPIALNEANRAGLLHRGDLVAVVGFGAGLTYGAAVFDW